MDLLVLFAIGVIIVAVIENQNSGGSVVDTFDTTASTDSGSPDPVTANIVDSAPTVSRIQQWADAIFHFEGGNPGNLNVRNNNPGNLKAAPDSFPQLGKDSNGFVIFASMDDGFAALNHQLMKYLADFPSLTLTQFEAHYLGQQNYLSPQVTNQGNPFTYADNIAAKLGVSPGDTLQSIFGGAA